MAPPSPGGLAVLLEQAAALLATAPDAAERQALPILQAYPNDPRAGLIVASARRRRGDHSGARQLLEPLARAYPRAANTHYELGLARAGSGEATAAIAALRQAVTADPDLGPAWRALGEALFRTGEVEAAEAAFAAHLRATLPHPRLKAAADALAQGALAQAEALLQDHLAEAPRDTAALRLQGDLLARMSRYAEAEAALTTCLHLDPAFDGARFTYADVLFQQQKAPEAIAHVRRLLARDGADPAYRNLLAACLSLTGEFEAVADLYRDLLAEFPGQPKIWLNYGHALRSTGPMEEAVAAYRRAIALAPGLGDAYWSLANLKLAAFSDGDVAAIRAQLIRGDLADADRLHLHYALGKALEDRGEDAGAFRHYAAGAALRRAQIVYSPEATTAEGEVAEALFTPAFFADRQEGGDPSPEPIFVVGLPRSGSTLVEQVLASHSAVEGTMELPDLGLIARGLGEGASDGDALRVLAGLDARERAGLGRRYLDATRIHRRLGRPMFIDKMPNNFRHLGLIQLILPKARIVDVRRHPMAACFAAFKQHFAQGQSFSYDLTELGLYYRDYVARMNHLDAVLPGRVHRVIYEDLVEDTEAQVRSLLAYCGLAFEPACLRFYENRRPVRTVSSEQVRRPIFREGLERWRRFEPWLGALAQALGPAREGWRGRRAEAPRPDQNV